MNSPITPQYGGIIYVNRGIYKHYGIYKNDHNVIHFSPVSGFELDAKEAAIRETTLAEFLKGGILCVERNNSGAAYSPAETVLRAEAQRGKHKGDYNLVFYNCEHFARWCKYGEPESHQVQKAVIAAAAVVVAGTTLVINAIEDKKKKNEGKA
jgi:hypothetical protein